MASYHVFLFVAAVSAAASLFPEAALGGEMYVVGGDDGWTLNYNYSQWAEEKTFYVGDMLVFNYNPSHHDVVKVTGPAFKACNASDGIGTLTSGKDMVTLASPGKKWYICSFPGHCAGGMKLVINVKGTEAPVPAAAVPPITGAANSASASWKLLLPLAAVAAAFII